MAVAQDVVSSIAHEFVRHLWQSTLLAFFALLLVRRMTRSPANARFSVLLFASAKFLVPFALLVRFGELFSWLHFGESLKIVRASAAPLLSTSFIASTMSTSEVAPQRPFPVRHTLGLFVTIWLAGVALSLLRWWKQWHRVKRIQQVAEPLIEGQVAATLRRVERKAGLSPMPLYLSPIRIEPGIFGVLKPVLLWPLGLSEQLSGPQQEAILAHEVWHAHRHDNLAAALHAIVEAVFWFNPLVWWIGAQMIREREEACDEAVLSLGSSPEVYAESILTACKFCLEAPLPYVAGVSSSNLQQRIARIMTEPGTDQLSSARKTSLALLALAAIIAPVIVGISISAPVHAQVAQEDQTITPVHLVSIKRDQTGDQGFFIHHTPQGSIVANVTLRKLVEEAYGLRTDQIVGGPSWADSARFDITYTGGDPVPLSLGYIPTRALRGILTQNFHLALSHEVQSNTVYALSVNTGGPTLMSALPPLIAPGASEPVMNARVAISDGIGHLSMSGSALALSQTLSSLLKTQVSDQTGLNGTYDIQLQWSDTGKPAEDLANALKSQMGLMLTAQQAQVSQMMISNAQKPAEF